MLRLVFCDVDGTVLPHGQEHLSPEILDTFRRLTDRSITVAVASGRPYGQLRDLFGSLAHRLIFICLDGAVTRKQTSILHKRPIPRKTALALLEQFPCAAVYGRETVYCLGHAPTSGHAVDTPNEIGEDFLKLELFSSVIPPRSPHYRIAYQEPGITELVAPCANKGNAALTLMQKLSIDASQAVAFGDGVNDTELLAAVGHPYRMCGTLPESSAAETDSVAGTLRTLFHL